jgi:transposase
VWVLDGRQLRPLGAAVAPPRSGATRLFLQAEIGRLDCRRCGRVRTEVVPWARPRSRHTRDFEDVVAWLAQRVDKTTITRLLRCSWEAVAGIVTPVVTDHLDQTRLVGLYSIGVDDVSYREGHRDLTLVADHDRDGRWRESLGRHPRGLL